MVQSSPKILASEEEATTTTTTTIIMFKSSAAAATSSYMKAVSLLLGQKGLTEQQNTESSLILNTRQCSSTLKCSPGTLVPSEGNPFEKVLTDGQFVS